MMSTPSLLCHLSSTFKRENKSSCLLKTDLIFELASAQQQIRCLASDCDIEKSKHGTRSICFSRVDSREFDVYGNNLPPLEQANISRDNNETLDNNQNIEKCDPCKKEINGELTNTLLGVGQTVTSTTASDNDGDDYIYSDDILFESSRTNEILECSNKATLNKQKIRCRRHKKLRGKKLRRQYKDSMKNKVSTVDLPSVTKAIVNKKASALKPTDICLGANCTAIKLHQNPQQPRNYHHAPSSIAKNDECHKTVYGYKTLPVYSKSKSRHSASLSVTCQTNTTSNRNVCSWDASHTDVRSSSPRVSLNRRSVSQATNNYINRITKIYQSQTQSGTVEVCGVDLPCAPPATPTPEQLKTHQYVPSLNDIMAQRAVKLRLEKMEKKEQKKIDKKKEEELKQEKIMLKDKLVEKKKTQRLEIYALNKVMTELENKKFKEFCEAMGIS